MTHRTITGQDTDIADEMAANGYRLVAAANGFRWITDLGGEHNSPAFDTVDAADYWAGELLEEILG